ncbi:DUF4437 domain-containing protein [Nostoc sp. 'Peltigera malacea cyanobiont' DB3992]|uniref:DUF4437 domain-containing protein n=1 Tax=Nostoc sp. 'Peltigera malacea cyanobiont' DB3992 TaxID=1206980 RepID=UPI000C046CC4|nr:DUF4437 domain-containing protein [Nostoc sp. 'Peltigera malacea cyanobiont' DB3992]PHM10675.1 hypothetical protein CK516_07120 [Nostoc sp. 'Peltigera malacea cyanobiont' DB3992]
MGEENKNFNSGAENDADNFLDVAPIKEDWGGDGKGRLSLSGRSTAISKEYVPRKYQFFNTNAVPEEQVWRISGMPDKVIAGKRKLLTWHNCGASTSRVILPPGFVAPSGIFTADLEIFILGGEIQIGEWRLDKHSYSFIPAGVRVEDWKVLGEEQVEILWMENGPVPLKYINTRNCYSNARLSEFIPILDSKLLAWGQTQTVQFEVAKKKFLRKHNNGGGTWLLAILPHYDGHYGMTQSYNEEAYALAGYCDIGNYRFAKDHLGYCPSYDTFPRHRTVDGGLFFVRVDRDISQLATVSSYGHINE